MSVAHSSMFKCLTVVGCWCMLGALYAFSTPTNIAASAQHVAFVALKQYSVCIIAPDVLHVGSATETATRALTSAFPDATLTCVESTASLPSTQGAYDIVTMPFVFANLNISTQTATLVECARLLRFGGHVCVLDTHKCDWSRWTQSGNRRLANAGFVGVRVQNNAVTSLMMASRSRFEPISFTEQQEVSRTVVVPRPKKRSILLMLADLPVCLLKLMLLYMMFSAIYESL